MGTWIVWFSSARRDLFTATNDQHILHITSSATDTHYTPYASDIPLCILCRLCPASKSTETAKTVAGKNIQIFLIFFISPDFGMLAI